MRVGGAAVKDAAVVAVAILVLTSVVAGTVAGTSLSATDDHSAVSTATGAPVPTAAVTAPTGVEASVAAAADARQNVTVSPGPDEAVLTPGSNYTFDVTTGVGESITNPTLQVAVSAPGEATPVVAGVTSPAADYDAATTGLSTQSTSVSGNGFAADSIHRALVRVHVPEGTETLRLEVQVGDESTTDDAITREYHTTNGAPSWDHLATLAESRQQTVADLDRAYNATVHARSVDDVVNRGLWRTFSGTASFTAGLLVGKVPYVGTAVDMALTVNDYRTYYQNVRADEQYPDPWLGATSQAQTEMVENGFTSAELDRVASAGNSSYILRRVQDLAAEEAAAWRNHNRERALDKLKKQHEYLTPTDTYPEIYVDLPETVALNDEGGESVFEPAGGGQFNLYRAADRQRSEAANGPSTSFADEEPFENAELFFSGLRDFATAQGAVIETTVTTVQDPDPSVTLTNEATVREQLVTEGPVEATFEVENGGGATSIEGYLSLSYSNDTLAVTDVEQVEEEPDGAVRPGSTYREADRGTFVNDTLTTTSLPGDPVQTSDGDRESIDRAVTDIYERFAAGETNTYTVTFERTGPPEEPANISYRLAFQPLIHDDTAQSTFVRAPTGDGTETGPQGWSVGTVHNASGPRSDLRGSGTATDPYVLRTATQLQSVADDLDAHYVLGADIDASETASWNDGSGFDPVGAEPAFTGTLDGQGHAITNLTIDRSWNNGVALFDDIGVNGTVTDLRIRDADIHAEGHRAVLAGDNDGTVRRVSADGEASGAHGRAGGLVGVNSGTITESTASVSVSGEDVMGGLVGANYGTITDSYATGSVSGYYWLGGLVGINDGTVERSYAATGVGGHSNTGGLIGSGDGTVSDSYWDTNATGEGRSEGGTELTTTALTGQGVAANLSAFDFGQTWQPRPDGYPALAWESVNAVPTAGDDAYTTTENTTLSVDAPGVLGNDTDPDGDGLAAAVVEQPANGTVTLDSDGSFEYVPDAGATGTDTFVYEVRDGDGATDRATVTISIEPDHAGLSVDAPATVAPGEQVTVALSAEHTGELILNGDTGGWTVVETDPATLTTAPAPSRTPYDSEPGDSWGHVFATVAEHRFTATLTAPEETGTYNFTAESAGDGTATSRDFSVTVTPATPEFAVNYTLDDRDPTVGENVTASATVANTGDATGTVEVVFTADGTAFATERVGVSPGTRETVDATTNFSTAGAHTVAVEGLNGTNVTVVEPAAFDVDYAVANATVSPAENVSVTATVENTGGARGATELAFRADGTVFANRTLTLAPGNATTVSATTRFETTGTHTVSVGDANATTVGVEHTGPAIPGVEPAVGDAVASGGDIERTDVLHMIDTYLGDDPIDGVTLSRSDVLNVVQYYLQQ